MEQLRFTTEDGVSLQGELRHAEGPTRAGAVLCHPHPRLGGSKDHPLLWAIRNELAHRGIAVLSFNFRGVMGSGGTYGGGRAELRDVSAAVGRIRDLTSGSTLVCGWSFGANVAIREAIADERVGALALVGLPLGEGGLYVPELPSASELRSFRRPVLLLSGETDPLSASPDLDPLVRALPRAELEVVPGTDHHFWRREAEAARRVGSFAERALGLVPDQPGGEG